MAKWRVFRKAVAVTSTDVTRLRTKAYGKESLFVFNPDQKRKQAPLRMRDSLVSRVRSVLIAQGLLRSRRMRTPVALVSMPGCLRQAWHTDYDTTTMRKTSEKPMGVLLALQKETRFEMPRRTVRLGAGDLLVFDGDVVHAGAAYSGENIRMHAYIDRPTEAHPANETYLVDGVV